MQAKNNVHYSATVTERILTTIVLIFYNTVLLLAYPLLCMVSFFHRRLRENFRLRKNLPDFTPARGKLLLWFHAASAGEYEQARAVAQEFKKKQRDIFLAFSFFSDSAWHAKKNDPLPDFFFALPWDFPWAMRALIKKMQPDALIIAKYDAWPNQVRAANKAGIPVYLISATLPEKSLRWRFPWRYLLRPTYAAMRRIFSVNVEHAERMKKISPGNVVASGDTRFDAIALRLAGEKTHARKIRQLRQAVKKRPILLAGSTYPKSESMLISFLAQRKNQKQERFFLIIAPHHVGPNRIAEIEKLCAAAGLQVTRWSTWRFGNALGDAMVVDALGVLPHLYPLAQVAYVGGGFEGSVHSVIEPVIAGVPVVTGPAIANSPEAQELHAQGMLTVLAENDPQLLGQAVQDFLSVRRAISTKLKTYFRQRVGASRQIVHTVMDDLLRK